MTDFPEALELHGGLLPAKPNTLKPRILKSRIGNYTIEITDKDDPRVTVAHEMEVHNLVELGDPEEEVRDEMLEYHDNSSFILSSSPDGTLEGMMRVVPHALEKGLKTFNDLAEILTYKWQYLLDYEPDDKERSGRRQAYLQEVQGYFIEDTGQPDLTKVWDVPTLATNLGHTPFRRVEIAQSLTAALAQVTVGAYRKGELTHVVSFNQVEADEFFKKLGYPIVALNGFGPMLYDSYGSGQGIVAQPAWFSVAEVEEIVNRVIENSENYSRRIARHMGMVALEPVD